MQQWVHAGVSGHVCCKAPVTTSGTGLQSPRPERRLRGEMTTVLITQCLQRDFVDPIGPHDPLPNLLHVGYSESTRLLGPEPAAGPLAQLIDWARGLPSDAIDLVH